MPIPAQQNTSSQVFDFAYRLCSSSGLVSAACNRNPATSAKLLEHPGTFFLYKLLPFVDQSLRVFSNSAQFPPHQCRYSNQQLNHLRSATRSKLAPLAVGVSLLSAVLTSTGCGSSNANVRLVNAMTGTSSIDMLLDHKSTITGIAYGTASGYVKAGRGSHNLIVENTGSSSPLINQTGSFSSGDTTVVATNSSAMVLTDDNSAPSAGNIKIRVINASPSLGSADVYIVASGNSIAGLSPTFSNLGYQSTSGYQTLAAGSYQVIFTPVGQQFAELTSNAQSFSATQIRTLATLDNQGGGFTTSVLSDLN